MIKHKVWRFYCEFCGRGSCSGGHIAKHERGCTANPNRECGICKAAGLVQHPMKELIIALLSGKQLTLSNAADYQSGMRALRNMTEDCPACILAAIRQSGIQRRADDWKEGDECPPDLKFDFKKELGEFWQEYQDDQDARCHGGF